MLNGPLSSSSRPPAMRRRPHPPCPVRLFSPASSSVYCVQPTRLSSASQADLR